MECNQLVATHKSVTLQLRNLALAVCAAMAVFHAPFASAAAQTPVLTPVTLASLPGGAQGLARNAWAVSQGSDGHLYGVALGGGVTNGGGVFGVDLHGNYSDLYEFSRSQNMQSLGGLMQASNGSFYGMLVNAAADSSSGGSIYSLSPGGQFSTLHTFAPQTMSGLLERNADGSMPEASFVQTTDGTLYGVAYTGGSNGDGTLFSLSPSGTFTLLYTFGGGTANTVGINPMGALVVGNDGNLYGTTRYGGANGMGAIYQVTPAGAVAVMQSFPTPKVADSCGSAAPPNSGALTLGSNGKFYGARCAGGTNGTGMLFKFDPATATITTLHDFAAGFNVNVGGSAPTSSLALGADGNLYGTASSGGANATGTVFALTQDGTFHSLYDFSASGATDGSYPWPLIVGADNNFYGSTVAGGSAHSGTVFKMPSFLQNDIVLTHAADSTVDVRPVNALGAQQIVQTVASGYYPVAVADFDGDGVPDILWTSANNDLYLWLGGKGSSTGFKSVYVGTYPAGWQVTGAGDIDGDGKADLYWINQSTHQFGYWLMNGAVQTATYSTSFTPGYFPIAEGDFNGDGKLDVLWSSASNDLYIWYSNVQGASHGFTSAYVGTYASGWSLVGVGDLDGDGKSDLIWNKNDGSQWGYWLMNGNQSKTQVAINNNGINGQIVGVDDYNSDGLADLLWSDGSHLSLATNAGTCATQCSFNVTALTAPAPGSVVFKKNIP